MAYSRIRFEIQNSATMTLVHCIEGKKFTKFSATHLHLFVELCQQSPSATRALVVDAKDETALDFYLRLNFFRLSETSLRAVLLSPKRTL